MSDPTLPPSLAAELADLRRRLDNLERSQRLPFSSTRGGAFRFLDNNGATRMTLGNVALDGSIGGATAAYGLMLRGDQGAIILMTRAGEDGLAYPELPVPVRDPNEAQSSTTSGTFAQLWEARWDFPPAAIYVCQGFCSSAVGTTGEMRLRIGATSTSALTIPSGASNIYTFEWLHPAPTGLYDPNPTELNFIMQIEARRTSGTGNVSIARPHVSVFTSKLLHGNANSNGNPVLS